MRLSRLSEEIGASLTEYVLLVTLVAIFALVAVTAGGREVSDAYSNIADSMQAAGG